MRFTRRSVFLAPILLLILIAATLAGCKGIDGRTDSAVTGEYSGESEIKAAARQQEAALIETANTHQQGLAQVQSRLDSLYAAVDAELAAIGAENIKRNSIIERGLGITAGLIDTFVPQAKPITDGIFPLFSDLLLLGGAGAGVGVWQRRRGTQAGAESVASGVQVAADADPAFKALILSGDAGTALTRHFQSAPAPVKKAIERNEVV